MQRLQACRPAVLPGRDLAENRVVDHPYSLRTRPGLGPIFWRTWVDNSERIAGQQGPVRRKELVMSENTIWPETEFRCNGGGGCVLVERIAGAFVIRDSKNPTQPGLVFSRKEYADFRRR